MAEKMQICPWCSNENPIGTQFCHSCRRKLFEYDQQSPTPNQYQQQQQPSNQPRPTAQKIRYEPTTHSCPYCGSRLWWADKYQSYYCAQCKKYISPQQSPVYQVYQQPQQPIIVQPPKASSIGAIVAGIAILIVAIILIYAVASSFNVSIPDDQDDNESTQLGNFYRDYSWDYGGYAWSWDLYIPKQSYYEYEGRYRTSNLSYYVTENEPYVISLANGLANAAESKGYDSYEKVSFVMAFVQSLPYTSDSVTTGYNEYPRYPVETLVDNGGDCEDTSILFAALLEAYPLNYDAVLFEIPANLPIHVAVGIWGEDGAGDYYYTYQGRNYYYCETTGSGWKIGEMSSEYIDDYARIIQV